MRTHYIRRTIADNDQRNLPLQRVMTNSYVLFVPKKLVPLGTENPYRIKCRKSVWRVIHFIRDLAVAVALRRDAGSTPRSPVESIQHLNDDKRRQRHRRRFIVCKYVAIDSSKPLVLHEALRLVRLTTQTRQSTQQTGCVSFQCANL